MEAEVKAGWGTSLTPGDVIDGKYRLEAVIGRGGMSIVYRATHLHLEQQVALKVLSAEALHLPEYVLRLRREARAVSRIRSEHVVRIHDIGELEPRPGIPGVPYLVMEYLEGLDLAAVLARRKTLPVELAVECIMQSCEALAEAHALGIVHRDLKPANLFLTDSVDGSPCIKVLDFGISRMSRRHGLTSLTDPGTVLGTPSYMAPEQMEAGEKVDARSDIWGLGTILYELLVGSPPYAGESLPQIFIKIMRTRPTKPSAFRGDVPTSLDALIGRCLAVDPSNRFQSVADLAWALSTVGTPRSRDSAERVSRVFDNRSNETGGLHDSSVMISPTPPPWRESGRAASKAVVTLSGAVILGAASVFGVLAARGAVQASAHTSTPAVPMVLAAETNLMTTQDAAVVITPMTRPQKGAPAAAVPKSMTAAALRGPPVGPRSAENKPAGQPVENPPVEVGPAASEEKAPESIDTPTTPPSNDVD